MKRIGLALLTSAMLSSCATYHMSTQSLLEQCASAQREKKITVFVAFPLFYPGIVNGNDLTSINVLDKNEHKRTLYVTRHTGIRVTQNTGKRTTFYFDTMFIQDSTITGSKTHFIQANIRPIKLANVTKIELQK